MTGMSKYLRNGVLHGKQFSIVAFFSDRGGEDNCGSNYSS